jgi:acetylxylan esterase
MSTRLRFRVLSFASVGAVLLGASPAFAAWGSFNYGGGTVDMYTPKTPASPAPLIVALHYCGGSASSTHGWLDSQADMYGFYLIAPQAAGNCFDASPGRTGEKATIAAEVAAMISQKGVDKTRVFAAGASSGGCMTQTMLATYPDVFAGGSALAGVPAGAWMGGNTCGVCSQNAPTKTAVQWGDLVRNADTGFTGTRPRVQIWSGNMDTTLNYPSEYNAEIAQWTNVFGLSDTNATTQNGIKVGNAMDNRTSYKDANGVEVVEGNVMLNEPHDLTGIGLWPDVVRFFGLNVIGSGGGDAGSTSGSSSGGHDAGSTSGSSSGSASTGTSGSASSGTASTGTSGSASSGTASTGTSGSASTGTASTGTSGSASTGTASTGTSGSAASGNGGSGNSGTGAASGNSNSGTSGSGTTSGSGGSSGSGSQNSGTEQGGGCSVRVSGAPSRYSLAALGALGLGLLVRRRRRNAR